MTPKNSSPNENEEEIVTKKAESDPEPAGEHGHRKRRKHGYRGYPNNPEIGGAVHMGTGFAGVGPTGGAGPSGSGLISEKTRESVEELGEDGEEE